MEYVVIFEEGENGCSAYVPDLPGCIAAGDTIETVRTLVAEAIAFHIEGLREDGDVVPLPSSSSPIPIDPGMLVELRI
ncbi:type II toxin-antitoxin system HicB family antitoxin [Candidatus Poribacteria bacterium]|nr:type II toxin-antitoxin system HicB family antitoxin [Candidatus Poribacteria bacterium]MXY28895.1 type II toxin-antitoxin system HicB family antitoxin [Candidatus Poribacteria bacterium]MYK19316.1 type II toxin-antitoxin system HicB family antitoxin [Candidatus Poribacteria bacterium]